MAKTEGTFEGSTYSFFARDVYDDDGILKVVGRDSDNATVGITLNGDYSIKRVSRNIQMKTNGEWVKGPVTEKQKETLKGKMEDGGERMSYDGGALREPSTGKGRYDLISPFALERVACWDPLDDKDHIVADNLEMAFLHINNFKRGNRRTDHIAAATRYILAELNNQYPDFDNKHGLWLGCINPFVLERLAIWYELGCVKYLPRNWESGMSYCRLVDSGMRHLNRFRKGERGEDHLIASVWNWFAYMHYEAVHLDKFDDVPKYPEANSPSKSFSEGGKELGKALEKGFGDACRNLADLVCCTMNSDCCDNLLKLVKNLVQEAMADEEKRIRDQIMQKANPGIVLENPKTGEFERVVKFATLDETHLIDPCGNLKVVVVQYNGFWKPYCFKVPDNLEQFIKPDTDVLVNTANGLSLAHTITRIMKGKKAVSACSSLGATLPLKEVVGVLTDELAERLRKEGAERIDRVVLNSNEWVRVK